MIWRVRRSEPHRDDDHPGHGNATNEGREAAQIERARLKAFPVDDAHQDRDAICAEGTKILSIEIHVHA